MSEPRVAWEGEVKGITLRVVVRDQDYLIEENYTDAMRETAWHLTEDGERQEGAVRMALEGLPTDEQHREYALLLRDRDSLEARFLHLIKVHAKLEEDYRTVLNQKLELEARFLLPKDAPAKPFQPRD